MKDILFRGKRIDNGEWVYGSFVMDVTELTAMGKEEKPPASSGFIRCFNAETGKAEMQEVHRETVGQYIGLTDKNGSKIFEGDVIIYDRKLYEMRYIEKYARFAGKNGRCVFAVVPFGAIEIIGNIHDDPKLMEEVNKK